MALRFGLVGTGPWARLAHGPGLLLADDVELVGVWGRNTERTKPLATALAVAAYADYEAMLGDVDAVAFAVPPDIQADLATTAANAGKHVLLDKPIAGDMGAARELTAAVNSNGVASVVFFTDRFAPSSRAWFDEVGQTPGWRGGWAHWFSALQAPDNPFGHLSWRHVQGALWDTGPHVLSTLSTALGPIVEIAATAGAGDLVNLVLRHDSGAMSTATLTQFAPLPAVCLEITVWGDAGFSTMPPRSDGSVDSILAVAAQELARAAESGEPHAIDVNFGLTVVELLDQAQTQLGRS